MSSSLQFLTHESTFFCIENFYLHQIQNFCNSEFLNKSFRKGKGIENNLIKKYQLLEFFQTLFCYLKLYLFKKIKIL